MQYIKDEAMPLLLSMYTSCEWDHSRSFLSTLVTITLDTLKAYVHT